MKENANMAKQRLGSLSRGFAEAMDDIRHNVVEVPMYGREVTSDINDFRNWLYGEPAKAEVEADGKDKEKVTVEVEPPEGRPSNHGEREAMAEAYEKAGPNGRIEIENIHGQEWRDHEHSAEWREFAEWLGDGREAGHTEPDLGRDDLER